MRITTSVTVDILTGVVIDCQWYEYQGSVALMKGGSSKAEMNRANALQDAQMQLMQQQLGLQMGQINAVNPILDQIIKAGGMLPSEESALTSIGINQLPQDFRNLEGSLSTQLLRRGVTGGGMAGSGEIGRNFGQLGAMEDFMKSQLLSKIQLEKQAGLRQALASKLGIGGMFGGNVGLFNQGGIGALGIGQRAAQAADEASSSFWGSLIGAAGNIGASAFGAGGIFGKAPAPGKPGGG